MARPLGVTILGALQIAGGVATTLAGVSIMRNPSSASALGLPPEFVALGSSVGILLVVSGVMNLVVGWGLLKRQNWARVVMLVITALSAGGAALGILTSGVAREPIGTDVLRLGVFAIDGLIVWYLLRPESKTAFTPHPPGQTPPVEPPAS